MKRLLRRFFVIATALIVCPLVGLFLTRSRPVVLRIPPDDSISPRYYCVMNPFRDKGPENVAVGYLSKLRSGQVQSISCCIHEEYFVEKEKEWPIQSWRLSNRTDYPRKSVLLYWVKRGNGYYSEDDYEADVLFTIVDSGQGWELGSFSAAY
ncbi:MAG TPA: hypothetical protein VIX17_09740 [Pyrinomonadaceae bacterium]|jgi:hypothetical protein